MLRRNLTFLFSRAPSGCALFPRSSFARSAISTTCFAPFSPALMTTAFRFCSSSNEGTSPASTSTSASTNDSTTNDKSSSENSKLNLTPEERAALCAPPTVVTAANFEQLVMQSQLALCLTYHVDNVRCRQFMPRIEEAVTDMNLRTRTRWLSLMTIDADRNPSLAGAFSVERVKLPITYFVYCGTIVDKVNGAVPKERLSAILHRFMEYYQEQKGVDLEDHGFAQQAKVEALTEALSTQEYEGKLDWLLLSRERVWAQPPTEARKLVEKATVQAAKDLRELQDAIGMNVKKIPPAVLFETYYSKPAYVAAARCAFFGALIDVIDTSSGPEATTKRAADSVKKALDEYRHGMAKPTVRHVACVAQIRLAERYALDALRESANAHEEPGKLLAPDAACLKALSDIVRWVKHVDVPGGLDGVFPKDAVDEMLASYRQLTVLAKKRQQLIAQNEQQQLAKEVSVPGAEPKAVQTLVGDVIRATLQLFPDDAKCTAARARFGAMIH